MTPTARSLRQLAADGWTAQVVEKWIPQARRRVDLFGVGDVLAIKPGEPVLMIQATTGSNIAARRTKALAEPKLRTWLAAGGMFELWAWAKRGARGERKVWTCRREPIALADLGNKWVSPSPNGDAPVSHRPDSVAGVLHPPGDASGVRKPTPSTRETIDGR